MFQIDFSTRIRSKAFWLFVGSIILQVIQKCGLDPTHWGLPSNYVDVFNNILTALTALGIVVDTSTPGFSDKVIAKVTEQAISNNTEEQVKNESSSTAIGNVISENSQSMSNDQIATIISAITTIVGNNSLDTTNQNQNNSIIVKQDNNNQA